MSDEGLRTEQFPVRLTTRSKALLQKLADTDSRSMNDVVILAINEYAATRRISVVKKGKNWV